MKEYYLENLSDAGWGVNKTLILQSNWKDKYRSILAKRSVDHLTLNWALGWKDTNIHFLSTLQDVGLKGITLVLSDAKDLNPLRYLLDLEVINITDTRYISCPDFATFPKLRILNINYRSPAKSLFNCKNLNTLGILQYPHKDLQPLSHMIDLRELCIYKSSKLESLSGINHLKNLELLDLYRCNKLASLDGIQHAPKLTRANTIINKCKHITPDAPFADRVTFQNHD